MNGWREITVTAAFVLLARTPSASGAVAVISCYDNAPSQVRAAAHRLSDYTGIPTGRAGAADTAVRVQINGVHNARVGAQGYAIRTSGAGLTVSGNTDEGAANGVYTLLRTIMTENRKDPFSRKWDIEEKPHFASRMMLLAPYRYGASYGFAALSPDRWSFPQWKEYVDLMRLCNMTTLTMASTRMYHPDYPDSHREKWRFEVWKEVMEYCHQLGMKFNWFIFPNLVTEQCFWDNPDKRTVEPNAWWGNALIWSKAKDLILHNQKYTLEYFRGLDGLEIIFNDGGAHFDEPDPAAAFADQTRSYMKLMRDVGNDAQFIFWNWLMDIWTTPRMAQKNPKFKTLQDDVVAQLPKSVAWLDASMLTLIQEFGSGVRLQGNPPYREGLLIGKEAGFRPIIDIFWYMNPEFSINIFPHPFIQRAIQEAHYARDEIGADGVMGYRLAPPCRFVDDYVFFRLASDPSLTQENLVNEVAGLLCEKPDNQSRVKEAINLLEQFWTADKLEHIERAEQLFRSVLPQEKSKNLQYVSNGVTFLTYIARLAQPNLTDGQKTQLKSQLHETVKPMYIFQGLTADIVWTPEARRFFNSRVDMMVEDFKGPFIALAPEVVDRTIYPKATSKPFTLQWPKAPAPKTN